MDADNSHAPPNTASDTAPPVAPVRPAPDECCNSGCRHCVFDRYEDAMERYRAAVIVWNKIHGVT